MSASVPAMGAALLGLLLLLAGPLLIQGAYTDAKPQHFKGKFDPWKAMGLPRSQNLPLADTLRKAFKKGALQWHPDRCSRKKPPVKTEECEARMEEIHLAQEVLQDERKLQQWEAWDEDRRNGGPRQEGGRGFGGPRRGGGAQGGGRGGGGSAFGGGDFGDSFGGGMPGGRGGGGPRRNQPRKPPKPKPQPRPNPRPKPPQGADAKWRVVSREKIEGPGGSKIEHITRERDLPGTPMVQVESLEKTCYKAQKECQEKVIERRRRRKETSEL